MESHPMAGGRGRHGYANNSILQGEGVSAVKPLISQSIVDHADINHLSGGNPYRIADLGCSTGPNTFMAVLNIIQALELRCKHLSSETPEFQVFFNDHFANDFNTLFSSLETAGGRYFAAGVPGSFHGRLFPRASLHFVHSSYALQWLSRVPEEVGDEKSAAWNKGRFLYCSAGPQVLKAYAAQFAKDVEGFLRARAEELVAGGLMALVLIFNGGRENGDEPFFFKAFLPLESTLIDMVSLGKIDGAMLDSFNLPVYVPSKEEFQRLVERNGCFSIEKMQPFVSMLWDKGTVPDARRCVMQSVRAIIEEKMSQRFGSEMVDEIFERYYVKFEESFHDLVVGNASKCRDLFVLLKRVAA